jgi:hypothetical protein
MRSRRQARQSMEVASAVMASRLARMAAVGVMERDGSSRRSRRAPHLQREQVSSRPAVVRESRRHRGRDHYRMLQPYAFLRPAPVRLLEADGISRQPHGYGCCSLARLRAGSVAVTDNEEAPIVYAASAAACDTAKQAACRLRTCRHCSPPARPLRTPAR